MMLVAASGSARHDRRKTGWRVGDGGMERSRYALSITQFGTCIKFEPPVPFHNE